MAPPWQLSYPASMTRITYRIESENGWLSIVVLRGRAVLVRKPFGLEAVTLDQALGTLEDRIACDGWPAGRYEYVDLNTGESVWARAAGQTGRPATSAA